MRLSRHSAGAGNMIPRYSDRTFEFIQNTRRLQERNDSEWGKSTMDRIMERIQQDQEKFGLVPTPRSNPRRVMKQRFDDAHGKRY